MHATLLRVSWVLVCLLMLPSVTYSNPDPCLIVYTTSPTIYHYDVNESYTVTAGHPLYDPLYDRRGEVLIDINSNEIALDIYQAPNLMGFEPSSDGQDGFFSVGAEFEIVVDGWNNQPITYENVLLIFEPEHEWCSLTVFVDGDSVAGDSYSLGDLIVSTPTPEGNYYSDTIIKPIFWYGCPSVRIWAFADENYNGQREGDECFSAFSHDLTIPVGIKSWGAIKSLYQE